MLINEVDEQGNNVELGGEFLLEPNDHFNNLSVNLSLSVVQVPTNMYNKGESTRLHECYLSAAADERDNRWREDSEQEMVAEGTSVSGGFGDVSL